METFGKQIDVLVKLAAVQYISDSELRDELKEDGQPFTDEEWEEYCISIAAEDIREYIENVYLQYS